MSTVALSPPQPVILKGFMDEPLELLAVRDRGDAIEVAREVADEPMPFHADCVFVYDAGLFATLCSAAAVKDAQRLRSAWAQATPFRDITGHASDEYAP
jgi:hypothetical protein